MTRSTRKWTLTLLLLTVCAAGADVTAGETNLNLFGKDASWTFKKNTGDGSFELAGDADLPVGVLHYDFSNSPEAKSGQYVLASATTSMAEGSTELRIDVRSSRSQRLTFRLVDDSGQTHQYKTKISGTGDWETVRISLTRKLEHWGGAKDGKIHFPIKGLTLSVPKPEGDPPSGKVEYARAVVVSN